MSEAKAGDSKKARERRLAIAAVAMFLISGSIFGTLFYRQQQATAGSSDATRQSENIAVDHNEELAKKAGKMRPARLAKIKWLREKWRPWALQHKDILRRMLKAQPNDQAAFQAVYDAIPTKPEDAGIAPRDLVPDNALSTPSTPGAIFFTWNLVGRGKIPAFSDPQKRERFILAQQSQKQLMQQDFTALRDIEISRSMQVGPAPKLSLWASGRVTERGWLPNPNSGPREQGPHQEILPPYDFLK